MFKSIADSVHALERKLIMPEDVAKMIVFLASDDAGKITGVNIPVDSGAVHASPLYDFATATTRELSHKYTKYNIYYSV